MDAYLLGIDLGTSGAKLCLISEDGSSFYGCTESYELVSERPGYAEEDPEAWWQAVCRGVRTLLARSGIDSRMVRSVGFSGQMHGLVLVDGQGVPVRPAIVHCDARASSYREIATREELFDWGILNLAFSGFQLTTLAWLADHEPQSLEHARHILSPKDYVRYRLTGEFGTEWTDAAATLLFDVVHRCWSAQMIERLGIDPALLADVNAPYDCAGSVSAQASTACGLAEGTAVAFGGADQPMQALGNGVTGPGEATCTVGGRRAAICRLRASVGKPSAYDPHVPWRSSMRLVRSRRDAHGGNSVRLHGAPSLSCRGVRCAQRGGRGHHGRTFPRGVLAVS